MGDDTQFVFGVDLDGVCMDFYGSLRPYVARWERKDPAELAREASYGLKEWNIDEYGGYEKLHEFLLDEQFFSDAPPMDGAADVLRRLSDEDIRIRIITHRLFIKYRHQEAARQTVQWLDKHEIPYWDLCLVRDKPVVGADLYIEDTSHNIIALREAGRPTIIFTNKGNLELAGTRVTTWPEVEVIARDEHARWAANRAAERELLAVGRAP